MDNADLLAMAVGRAVLAFGQLDQTVWTMIMRMERLNAAPKIVDGEYTLAKSWNRDDIDERFTHRLKRLRAACVCISGESTIPIRKFDAWRQKVKVIERFRGRLAHASLYAGRDGRVEVTDEREEQEKRRRVYRGDGVDWSVFHLLFERTYYTIEEIDGLARDLRNMREELFDVQSILMSILFPPTDVSATAAASTRQEPSV
jgi:hypothetical protein